MSFDFDFDEGNGGNYVLEEFDKETGELIKVRDKNYKEVFSNCDHLSIDLMYFSWVLIYRSETTIFLKSNLVKEPLPQCDLRFDLVE